MFGGAGGCIVDDDAMFVAEFGKKMGCVFATTVTVERANLGVEVLGGEFVEYLKFLEDV